MKLSLFITIFGFIAVVLAANEVEIAPADPNYPIDCYSTNSEIGFVKMGEFKRLKDSCAQVLCWFGKLIYDRCPLTDGNAQCSLGEEDLRYAFPMCCPRCE